MKSLNSQSIFRASTLAFELVGLAHTHPKDGHETGLSVGYNHYSKLSRYVSVR